MKAMLHLADRYLRHRRRFGYRLRIEGNLLLDFARFADATAPGQPLQTALALRWATLPRGCARLYHAKRLELIRGFARYCSALDPRTEVPPQRLLGPAHHRIAPHIYDPSEVRLLLQHSSRLGPARSLRPLTFTTLIGLAASTGMRLCELLRLKVGDFDAEGSTLRVARAKFSPERCLPLHHTTVAALRRYLRARNLRPALSDHFFVSLRGRPLATNTVHQLFRHVAHGIRGTGARPRPRLHDFRHTFATRWIAEWSRTSAPVPHHLLLLSRYLGHRSFTETYWYISAEPRSLADAGSRFQCYFSQTDSAV